MTGHDGHTIDVGPVTVGAKVEEPGRFCRSWTTPNDVELGVVAEPRRPGEVAISVTTDVSVHAWVPVAEARRFAMALLAGAREADDIAAAPAPEGAPQ